MKSRIYSREEFDALINSGKPVLVDFYQPGCAPCEALVPVLEQLKYLCGEELEILQVDVNCNVELSIKYQIRGIPHLKLFYKGDDIWTGRDVFTAVRLKEIIGAAIDRYEELTR